MSSNAGPSAIAPTSFYGSRPTFNGVPRGHPLAGPPPSSSSSSFSGANAPSGPGIGLGAPSHGYARKRSASPENGQDDQRPNKQLRNASSMPVPSGSGGGASASASGSGLGQRGNAFDRVKPDHDVSAQFGGSASSPQQERAQAQAPASGQYRKDLTKGFVGKGYLREKLAQHLPEKATIPDDVLTYLSTATETYLRSLIRSSLSAQIHRTCTSHTRQPPFAYSPDDPAPSAAGEKPVKRTKLSYDDSKPGGKPLWTHKITSDPAAVIAALSKANRQAEQAFRVQRMDRIAREQDQRAHMPAPMPFSTGGVNGPGGGANGEMQGDGVFGGGSGAVNGDGSPVPPGTPGSGTLDGSSGVPAATDTSNPSPSTPAPATPAPAPATLNATPTFGATPIPSSKKTGKKYQKSSASLSSETQLRMSNATAARAAGLSSKKYSWMSSAPSLSSPLAGKKGKKGALGKGVKGEDDKGDESGDGEGGSDTEGGAGKGRDEEGGKVNGASPLGSGVLFGGASASSKIKRKSKLSQSTLGTTPEKKRKVPINKPTRRLVSIVPNPDAPSTSSGGGAAATSTSPITSTFSKPAAGTSTAPPADANKVPDDRAITFADVIFALKRDTTGIDAQGVVRRMNEKKWARERKEEAAAAAERGGGGGTGATTSGAVGGSGAGNAASNQADAGRTGGW